MKKRSVSIDSRSEPSASNSDFRVDRVYPSASRARSSSPNLTTVNLADVARMGETDLAKVVADLKRQLDDTQREFDETRLLWSAERNMLEQKARAELELSRKSARSLEIEELKANHAAELAELRAAHEAELVALRDGFEVELAELRGTVELDAIDAKTFAGERDRMAFELEGVRNEALREASEREKIYAQEQEQLARQQEAEITRRDDQIAALRQDIADLKQRCATLESESNSWALERLRLIAHLEEGLLLLGAARPDEEDPEMSVQGDDDTDDVDDDE
ncbi:MAG: hypothetical protein SFX73_16330 [Kofleriaceae bacterium]|nr:hypothetical protein [Kofleriaceae bacterium]